MDANKIVGLNASRFGRPFDGGTPALRFCPEKVIVRIVVDASAKRTKIAVDQEMIGGLVVGIAIGHQFR